MGGGSWKVIMGAKRFRDFACILDFEWFPRFFAVGASRDAISRNLKFELQTLEVLRPLIGLRGGRTEGCNHSVYWLSYLIDSE